MVYILLHYHYVSTNLSFSLVELETHEFLAVYKIQKKKEYI